MKKYTVLSSGLLLAALVAWFLALAGPSGVLLALPTNLGQHVSRYYIYAVTGVTELLLVVPLIVYMAIKKTSLRALMGNRTNLWQNLLALLFGVLLVPALMGLDSLMSLLFKAIGVSSQDTSMINPGNAGQLLAGMLAIGVAAGLVEEPIFRGVAMRGLGSAMGKHAAILITALVFSFFHLDIVGAFERFLLGAFFGYMVWRAGALLPSMIAHAAFNSTALGFVLLSTTALKDFNGFTLSRGLSPEMNGALSMALLSLPFAAAAFGVYRLFALVTPKTAAWNDKPYIKGTKFVHALPWWGVAAALFVLTAGMTLLMVVMNLPGLREYMQQAEQYLR